MDGVDFSPLLRGERFARSPIYWHYPHYSIQGGAPSAGVRDGNWKLIHHFETKTSALYNLRADLAEQHDLAVTQPEIATCLERMLLAWLPAVGALVPAPNPNPAVYPDLPGWRPSLQSRAGLVGRSIRRSRSKASTVAGITPPARQLAGAR